MSQKSYSLRLRLLLSVIGVSVFFWLLSLGTMVYVAWHETSDVFDDALKKSASLLLQAAQSDSFRFDNKIDTHNRELDEDDLHYQIIDQGKVVSKTKDSPARPFVADFSKRKGFVDIVIDGEPWRIYIITSKNTHFAVQVGQALEMRLEILKKLAENLIIPALLLLLALSLVSGVSIYFLLKPLTKMADALAKTSVHHLQQLPINVRSKELKAITNALNALLSRLGEAMNNERRFTADAAHELRTPLAALRMQAQLLQRTYPEMKEDLQKFQSDIDRAVHLVSHLLLLARLDPLNADDQHALKREPIELSLLFDDLKRAFSVEADRKKIALTFTPNTITLYANHEITYIALRNLIDNALRYTPQGSTVHVAATELATSIILEVEDNGVGLDATELAKVTQRFYRALGTQQSGSGLGLSIVERIVQLHQGDLKIQSGNEHQGLKVTLTFPKMDPSS